MNSGTILGRPLAQAVSLVTVTWGVVALVCEQLGFPIAGPIVAGVTVMLGAWLAFIAGGETARTAAAVDAASTTSSVTVTAVSPIPTGPSNVVAPLLPVPPSISTTVVPPPIPPKP
jgi:hypothetical protein